jgi:hypothetical protein
LPPIRRRSPGETRVGMLRRRSKAAE